MLWQKIKIFTLKNLIFIDSLSKYLKAIVILRIRVHVS
jgi:hypothetical protein